MARRDWGVIKDSAGEPGDQDAMNAAMAMAHRFDGDVIRSVSDALTSMDRLGGQLGVQVQRVKVDGEGTPVDRDEPGYWLTYGFIFSVESRDASVQEIKLPEPDLEQTDRHIDDGPEIIEEVAVEPEPAGAAA